MSLNKQQREELDQLKASSEVVTAEQVVAFARNPETALHKAFEWDDAAAAESYRLQQARQLIRLHVVRLPGSSRPVRALLSLPTDRTNGGGYRDTGKMAANPLLVAQLTEEALKEIEGAAKRFQFIPALRPVFDDLNALVAKHRAAMASQAVAV